MTPTNTYMMTKSEENILALVRKCNEFGALAGLSVSPGELAFTKKEFRFVKRLYDAEQILWLETKVHGAGWLLPEFRGHFPRTTNESPV